jgi:L-2,4-diaminobutyric acid acetyltransferase
VFRVTVGVQRDAAAAVRIRMPRVEDGAAMYRLIMACPPLDLNSAYAYLLVCDHFRETTLVAEAEDGRLLGCLTGYRRPDAREVLFIWQVAVHPNARGGGLGRRMLDAAIALPAAAGARRIETTISPSNTASRRLFSGWARSRGMQVDSSPYLEPRHFPDPVDTDSAHDAEHLYRIGPLPGSARSESHERGEESR